MGDIALDSKTDEWTPEYLMELGKEWLDSVTLDAHQKGVLKGEAGFLLRQLQRRFGALPDWATKRVQSANQDTLNRWSDRFVKDHTLALKEVLAE